MELTYAPPGAISPGNCQIKTNFLIPLQTPELLSLQQPLNKCLILIDS